MKSKSKNETLAQIRRLGLWRENEEKEILDFIEELGLILVDVHKERLEDEIEKKPPSGPDYRKRKARCSHLDAREHERAVGA